MVILGNKMMYDSESVFLCTTNGGRMSVRTVVSRNAVVAIFSANYAFTRSHTTGESDSLHILLQTFIAAGKGSNRW